MRPYYQDDYVTLYHGDALEIAPSLGLNFAVVTDPPYGIGYQHSGGEGCSGFKTQVRIAVPIAGDDGDFDPIPWLRYERVLLWGANHYAARLPKGCWIAWDKAPNGGPADHFHDADFAWSSVPTKRNMLRVQWKGCANAKAGELLPREHPSQKPLRLMRACIQIVGGNDPILDPYMGGGVTLRAAKDLGRRAIGIEIEERYCEIAARRMAQEVLALA